MTEFTFLMPCLNEAETVGFCINQIKQSINRLNLTAEIIVADNCSTDGSAEIAKKCGARVITVTEKGYGATLIAGIKSAQGKYIIMGDSDGSYAFDMVGPFVDGLRSGYALVMGNRFRGGIEKGAMPWLHKIGVPALSTLARWKWRAPVYDFHCGLRGFDRQKALFIDLKCPGMEFATEIIVKFVKSGEKILEVPTPLRKDKRNHPPHIRTFRDGWRHLKYILSSEK